VLEILMKRCSVVFSHRVLLSIAFALVALTAAESAAVPPILAPADKRFWVTAGIGPAIVTGGAGGVTYAGVGGKVPFEFGAFLLKSEPTGPALSLPFEIGFSAGVAGATIEITPKFSWYFQPISGAAFYVGPYVRAGVAILASGGAAAAGFDLSFGGEARLYLAKRGIVYCRPFAIGVLAQSGGAVALIDLFIIGGGVAF
jgi:hypothetical protein